MNGKRGETIYKCRIVHCHLWPQESFRIICLRGLVSHPRTIWNMYWNDSFVWQQKMKDLISVDSPQKTWCFPRGGNGFVTRMLRREPWIGSSQRPEPPKAPKKNIVFQNRDLPIGKFKDFVGRNRETIVIASGW